MNHSKHYKEVYSKDKVEGPYGWIQWKGTDVCIDLHCKCGFHGHVDDEFFYYWECPKCGMLYAVGQNVRLLELDEKHSAYVKEERKTLIKSGDTTG